MRIYRSRRMGATLSRVRIKAPDASASRGPTPLGFVCFLFCRLLFISIFDQEFDRRLFGWTPSGGCFMELITGLRGMRSLILRECSSASRSIYSIGPLLGGTLLSRRATLLKPSSTVDNHIISYKFRQTNRVANSLISYSYKYSWN